MWVRAVTGIVLCAVGTVWILQGTKVIQGSGMSGQGKWAVIGAVVVVVGLACLPGPPDITERARPIKLTTSLITRIYDCPLGVSLHLASACLCRSIRGLGDVNSPPSGASESGVTGEMYRSHALNLKCSRRLSVSMVAYFPRAP